MPAVDATTKLRIERDRAFEQPPRDACMPETARRHERLMNASLLIGDFLCATRSARLLEQRAHHRIIAERGENLQRLRQRVSSREQMEHARRARLDHVLPRR